MRLAVFSDVHGNLSALEAVVADIAGEMEAATIDEVVFAGDLCQFGPRPAECVDLLRGIGCRSLFGNTDDWVLGRQQPPEHFGELAKWTYEQLNTEQREWLDALPFSYTFSPAVDDGELLLIVHANPKDVNQIIFPPVDEQVARYGRVRQADEALNGLLHGTEAAAIALGHLHIPFTRSWERWQLFNISSVSMPGDGDSRAKYGLFTWEGAGWRCENKYVAYNYAVEIDAFGERKPPGWQDFLATIAEEGVFPQKV